MTRITRSTRCWLAIAIWGFGLLLFAGLAFWNLQEARSDAENRVIGEAGRIAAQLAGLLSAPGIRFDAESARIIAGAAMEDERVYAVKIESGDHLLAGMRRNYMWEPSPWDDEIAENCVQGMNPVRVGGKAEGKVEVWLSPRSSAEDESQLQIREKMRFGLIALFWTALLCLLLWHWGDFHRLARIWNEPPARDAEQNPENLVLGLGTPHKCDEPAKKKISESRMVDPEAAKDYTRSHPDAWHITAGLFRQTFRTAPALMGRLYADNELAGLCHLGRMLEQASFCIGASPLRDAAKKMQAALNDPHCEMQAQPVEECALALEKTLAALAPESRGEC